MSADNDQEFSEKQKKCLKYAVKVQYVSLAYSASVVTLMFLVMGNSQAMKTSWIEDMVGAIPGITFLIVTRFKDWAPTKKFPYGFHRIGSLGFLFASLTLLVLGIYLFFSAFNKLLSQEHPTIGMLEVFGVDLWQGWWMLMVLVWGTIPPLILGHLKIRPAEILNDKVLFTDAKMNKADWMTAVATAIGVMGIGLGIWWTDAVAAMIITLDIIKDGFRQTRDACTELMNASPKNLKGEYIDVPKKCFQYLTDIPWAQDARVRMYELGHVVYLEAFIVPSKDFLYETESFSKVRKDLKGISWKIFDVSLTLVSQKELDQAFPYQKKTIN